MTARWQRSWTGRWALLALAASLGGCGDICEDAGQICADERRVAAPEDDGTTDPVVCDDDLEAHATCIVEADSCAPDVVAACWESVGGDPG